MPVFEYPKQVGRQISDHFTSNEFNCPCSECKTTLVDTDLVEKLEKLRAELGTSLRVDSGYRCAHHQNELRLRGFETSEGISQHELGKAADITNMVALGHELAEAAVKAGFKAIGVGSNWVHVDLRDDTERRWSYVKR